MTMKARGSAMSARPSAAAGRRSGLVAGRSRAAAALVVVFVMLSLLAGAVLERPGAGEPDLPVLAPAGPAGQVFGRFDSSDREAHVGQLVPTFALVRDDGKTVELDHRDGRPRVMLLVRDDCSACDDAIVSLAGHAADSGYDPARARYSLAVVTVGPAAGGGSVADWFARRGWEKPELTFAAGDGALERVGFAAEQLPAWVFIYPDGTLAGREQGMLDAATYRRITALLAATVP